MNAGYALSGTVLLRLALATCEAGIPITGFIQTRNT